MIDKPKMTIYKTEKSSARIPLEYRISKQRFMQVTEIIKGNFRLPNFNNAVVGQMIMNFADSELKAEQQVYNQISYETGKYIDPETSNTSSIKVVAQISASRLNDLQHRLRDLYPEIANDKTRNSNNFLAYLGFVFAKRIESQQVRIKYKNLDEL